MAVRFDPDPAPGRLPIGVAAQVALLQPLYESLKDARDCYHVARREAHAVGDSGEAARSRRPSTRRRGLIAVAAGEAPDPAEPSGNYPVSDEEPSSSPAEEPASEESVSEEPVFEASDSDEPSDTEFPEIDGDSAVS